MTDNPKPAPRPIPIPQRKPAEMPGAFLPETEMKPWAIGPEDPGVLERERLRQAFGSFGDTSEETEKIEGGNGAAEIGDTEEEMATEEEIGEAQMQTGGSLGNLVAPEGFIMMGLAITLDVTGLTINLFGLDDCGILDIVGIVVISGWMLFRSQGKSTAMTGKTKKQAENFIKKMFTGKNSKFLTPIIGEIIPYVGALPCWTLAVFFEVTEIQVPGLTSGAKKQDSPTSVSPPPTTGLHAPATI